jgi:hypothetical protein
MLNIVTMIIQLALFISLSSQGTFAKTKELKLGKGKIFDLPEITDSCQDVSKCVDAAKKLCESKNALLESCVEQYQGNWSTSCKCL